MGEIMHAHIGQQEEVNILVEGVEQDHILLLIPGLLVPNDEDNDSAFVQKRTSITAN